MGSVVGAVVKAAVTFAIFGPGAGAMSLGMSLLTGLMGSNAKKGSNNTPSDHKLTLKSTVESRKRVYGEAMVSGPLVLKTTTGGTKEYLHLVVPLAAHRITEFLETWFDDTLSTASRINGYNRVSPHDGSILQAADADLVSEVSGWTTAHRGRGIAYVYARLKYNSTAWPDGIKNVKCVIRGKALYDPRLPVVAIASTAAGAPGILHTSAAHGLTVGDEVFVLDHAALEKFYTVASVPSATSLTLADQVSGADVAVAAASTGGSLSKLRWSNNFALAVLDYLLCTDGLNAIMAEINAPYWIAAANVSDEQVPLGATAICTADPATDVLTLSAAVPWQNGLQVRLTSTGTLPGGVTAGTSYAWVRLTPTTGMLAKTKEDAVYGLGIDLTSSGTGTLTLSAALSCTVDAGDLQQSATFSASVDTDVLTLSAGVYWATGKKVRLTSTGVLPSATTSVYRDGGDYPGFYEQVTAPLDAATDYFWIRISATTGKLAASADAATAGTALDIATTGTGAHTIANVVTVSSNPTNIITLSDNVPRDDDSSDDADQDAISPQFGWATGDGVQFCEGAAPTGLALHTTYYWIRVTNSTGRIAATHDAAIALSPLLLADAGASLTMARVSQPRYTVNGQLDLANKPLDNVEKLLTAGGGVIPYVQGAYRLHSAGVTIPSFDLSPSDLRDTLTVQAQPSKQDVYNAVRGTFVDPTQLWEASDLPPVVSDQYQAEDGGEQIFKDVEFTFTTDSMRGQRLMWLMLQEARQGITVDFPARLTAGARSTISIAPWDVGRLNFKDALGWDAKLFRVTAWKQSDDMGVDLTLKEYAPESSNWTPDMAAHADYAPNTSLASPWDVVAPTALTLESGTNVLAVRGDGTVQTRIKASWTPPADAYVLSGGTIEVQLKKSADEVWATALRVPGDDAVAYLTDVEDGIAYDVRIRGVNGFTAVSAWLTVLGHVVLGKSAPPTDIPSISAQQNGSSTTIQLVGVSDADLAGYRVGYAAKGAFDWSTSNILTKLMQSTLLTTLAIPPGDWTIGAKSVDTSGNLSTGVAMCDITIGSAGDVIITASQYPTWPGVRTGLVLNELTGHLLPRSQKSAQELGTALFTTFVPDPVTECWYETPEIDSGVESTTVRIWGQPLAVAGPGRAAPGVSTQLAQRSAGGSYGAFSAWLIGQMNGRYAKMRAVLDLSAGVGVLTGLTVTADAEPFTQYGSGVAAVGGTRVTFAKPHNRVPYVELTNQSATALNPTYTNLDAEGMTVIMKLPATQADVGGPFGWKTTGA
ncbi:phage tail protein [Humidesulfovibrio idahonensis]